MTINTYDDIELLFNGLKNLDHEEFWISCLDVNGNEIVTKNISFTSEYGLSEFSLHDLTKIMLNNNSDCILIAHNHTNNVCYPSDTDINTTNKIRKLCKLLEIHLIDHVIITNNNMYSFRHNKWGKV